MNEHILINRFRQFCVFNGYCGLLFFSSLAFAAGTAEDIVACMSSTYTVLQTKDESLVERLESLPVDENIWLLANKVVFTRALKSGARKFSADILTDQMLASGKLSSPERIVLSNIGYDVRNPVVQKALIFGQNSCQKLGKLKLASIIADGATIARNQYKDEIGEDLQSKKTVELAAADLKGKIEQHTYYKSCPAFKHARYACTDAGNYNNCMKIRYGTEYKNVQDSAICN